MILTFHSWSSSIFNDWYLSIFSSSLSWMFFLLALQCQLWSRSVLYSLSALCQADCEVSLNGKVLEELGVLIPDHFFWFCPPVFTVLNIVLSTYSPVSYWSHIVVSLSLLDPCELVAAIGDMCYGFCMLFAQTEFCILHSVVDIVYHCLSVEGLLLSWHDQSLGVCFDVAFYSAIDMCGPSLWLLTHICARHHAEASYTRLCLTWEGTHYVWSSAFLFLCQFLSGLSISSWLPPLGIG